MNNARALSVLGLLAAGVLLVASCGGGGQSASGGSGGTGMMARGSISQIGSIFVNGVEYETKDATIYLPGGTSKVDRTGRAGGTYLMEGMIVTVVGTVADDGVHGKATTVTYNRSLVGQMLVPTNPDAGFTLYGQQVVYDPDVRFESQAGETTLAAPVPGWVANLAKVEVSGFVLADGTVQASYVKELADLPSDLEIEGPVTSVAPDRTSIVVGGTTFRMPFDHDWGGNPIAVGTYVGVHFILPDATAVDIDAQEVEIEDMDLAGAEGELGELEGVITAGGNPFTIAGQQVYTNSSTRYESGASGDLDVGRKIEVLGTFSGGRFVAQVVEFE